MSHDNIVLQDRIKELSHTTGTGPYILDGKINGFSPFTMKLVLVNSGKMAQTTS